MTYLNINHSIRFQNSIQLTKVIILVQHSRRKSYQVAVVINRPWIRRILNNNVVRSVRGIPYKLGTVTYVQKSARVLPCSTPLRKEFFACLDYIFV